MTSRPSAARNPHPADLQLRHEALSLLAGGVFSPGVEAWCSLALTHIGKAAGAEEQLRADLCAAVLLVAEALCLLSVTGNLGCEAAARCLAQVVAEKLQQVCGHVRGRAAGTACVGGPCWKMQVARGW